MKSEKGLLERLRENIDMFRKGLTELGFDLGNSQAHIIPVIIGSESNAYEFARLLQREGIFVGAVSWPVVPRGRERVRVTAMATHTPSDIDRTLTAFKKIGKEMGLI
jgi:glycine C-acetyltransferase